MENSKISEKLKIYYSTHPAHNKGVNKYPEAIKKMVETRKQNGSYKLTDVQKENRRKIALEKGYGKWMIGRKEPLETRNKISKSLSGENNYQWISDRSLLQYPDEFNNKLKEMIRERDGRICQKCNKTEKEELEQYGRRLSVNHIDFNKKNCHPNNLNALCMNCNKEINWNREYWTNYFTVNKT